MDSKEKGKTQNAVYGHVNHQNRSGCAILYEMQVVFRMEAADEDSGSLERYSGQGSDGRDAEENKPGI